MDFCCALGAGLAGFVFRFGEHTLAPRPDAVLAAGLPLLWVAWAAAARAYDARFFGIGNDEYRRILSAGSSLTAAVAVASYATKAEVARGYVVIALPLVTLLTLVARHRLRKRLHRRRTRGDCLRRVVAAGHREAVAELVREFGRAPYHGMRIVAACVPAGGGGDVLGVPVEGRLGDVADVVERTGAETVAVLACPELAGVELRRLAWRLEQDDTELLVASALLDIAGPRTTIRPVAGLPLLHVDHPELAGVRRLLKGGFDRVAAAFALVLLGPLWAVTALLIRADDPGPAIYAQERIGRGGRRFRMLKFRTMVVGADRLRDELSAAAGARNGLLFKLRDDPRMTRLGARLRRFSLDELPQLVNVLRGEMSLVGPRPPLPDEVDRYGEDVYRRLAVKPGMTGLWQVSGRSDLSWDESVRLDLRYIENWSLTLDAQILWKTIAAVVRGSGAY
ncbi:sugar transferase [Actinomadura vinacea]|uniref:Sugar transferase n=1 Tax=Actinomadura vinacea TaxID=115336 RepID=A0ABN3IZ21_9ACTN